ncbi:MAG: HIT domain-containing protein [Anaerolineaceae bacterium]|nr:HIT domain-containing protein [Anaerolineaceae bacterium]
MTKDPDCVFCRIVAGGIPSTMVAESDLAYAFMDIGPISKGHTLVIPKDHYVTLDDMPAEVTAAIYELAARIGPVLQKTVGAEGLNVLQNNGRVAGQVVMHVHVHLIPRWSDDGLKWPWPARQADLGELKRIADSVKSQLK